MLKSVAKKRGVWYNIFVGALIMIDAKTTAVLAHLNALCEGGGYKIIEEKDVLSALSGEEQIESTTFREIMRFLTEREWVSVKYEGEGQYCLSVLPKGRTILETQGAKQTENHPFTLKSPFTAGFLGGLTGALLGALIALCL